MLSGVILVGAALAAACASSPARTAANLPLEIPEPPPRVAMDPVPAVAEAPPPEIPETTTPVDSNCDRALGAPLAGRIDAGSRGGPAGGPDA